MNRERLAVQLVNGRHVTAYQTHALLAEPHGNIRRKCGDARRENGFVVAGVGANEHPRRGAPVEPRKKLARDDVPALRMKHPRGSDEELGRKCFDGCSAFVVMVRGIEVRAAMDAAREFANVARSAVAETRDETEFKWRVAGPRRESI